MYTTTEISTTTAFCFFLSLMLRVYIVYNSICTVAVDEISLQDILD